MARPPDDINTLRDLRRAAEGMTPDAREDYLWSVVESFFPPDADQTWKYWKLALPAATPQRLRMIDLLWRRRGRVVTAKTLLMAMHGGSEVIDIDKDSGNLRRRLHELRRALLKNDIPINIITTGDGYMLVLRARWSPPWQRA